MAKQTGKFVWFELVTANPAKAQAFYGEVLGWKVEKYPMEGFTYEMIKAGDAPVGGYAEPRGKAPAHWISHVSVADVDAAVKKAVAAGATVVEPATDVPTVGRMARIRDPFGAELFLFRGAGEDMPDAVGAGRFCWNELTTTDDAKALAFYEKVVGWTHRDMDMGPGGTYHVLQEGGTDRAGLTAGEKGAPSQWLPYVEVPDADATSKRAAKLGGKVEIPPTDIPNVGRFAVLSDPDGARFGILKPLAK